MFVCKSLYVHAATVSIPPGMVQDQFGMMGLLTFIRGAETDPNLVALALGRYMCIVQMYMHHCFCKYVALCLKSNFIKPYSLFYSDLTTLGLNLNSPEYVLEPKYLYSYFW